MIECYRKDRETGRERDRETLKMGDEIERDGVKLRW